MIDKAPTPTETFSPGFGALIENGKRVKHFLKENGFNVIWLGSEQNAWEHWKAGRQPIAKIIDEVVDPAQKTISVLDMGCANGFLLRCLQEWSSHEIDPYGADTNKNSLYHARKMFPGIEDHFAAAKDTKEMSRLPTHFDVAYWNVWDNYRFREEYQIEVFKRLKTQAGIVILGFYDHDPHDRYKKLERLRELGFKPLGIRDGKGTQTFAWFEGDLVPKMAVEN